MNEDSEKKVPGDFPRDYLVGAVSGVHPKLLVRKIGERYVEGLSADELYARFDNCIDMVGQLELYCHRKLQERPEWGVSELLTRVKVTLRSKREWDFSAGEVDWMMAKLSARMNASIKGKPPGGSK